MARKKDPRKKKAGAPVRGYDEWSASDLRAKLPRLAPAKLESLLRYERSGRNRKGAVAAIEKALGKPSRGRRPSRRPGIIERVGRKVGELVRSMGPLDLDRDRLLERLSEFLEHERGAIRLYEGALECIDDEQQRERLEGFHEETRENVRSLEQCLRDLGADPDERTLAAELDATRSSGLVEAVSAGEGRAGVVNALQCLTLVEWACHRNWEFLATIVRRTSDEEVKRILGEHVDRVEQQEDEHFRWAESEVDRLSLELISRAGRGGGGREAA